MRTKFRGNYYGLFWNWVVGRVFNYNLLFLSLVSASGRHAITGRGVCRSIKDGGGAAGGLPDMDCTGSHPLPQGRRKKWGRVPGRYGLYSTAIQNHLLKTGGYRKNRGA